MSRPRSSARPWYAGPLTVLLTVVALAAALREHRLGALIPVTAVLLAVAVVLYFVHLVSPLAPFVYSLF